MIEISKYGFRDGIVNARAVKLGQKKIQIDVYPAIQGTNVKLVASAATPADTATAFTNTVGTQMSCPRNVKITNSGINAGVTSGRYMIVKGYTGQGAYAEEKLLLKATVGSTVNGSIPFAKISSIYQMSTVGTYGTVSVYPGPKFGLTEYIDDEGDGLYFRTISNAGVGVISTPFAIGTNFSKPYQTVTKITAVTGSTVAIAYRSRFQQRNTDV